MTRDGRPRARDAPPGASPTDYFFPYNRVATSPARPSSTTDHGLQVQQTGLVAVERRVAAASTQHQRLALKMSVPWADRRVFCQRACGINDLR